MYVAWRELRSAELTGFYAEWPCCMQERPAAADPEFGAQQRVVAPGIGHESQSNWRLIAFNDAGDAIQRIELEVIEPLIWRALRWWLHVHCMARVIEYVLLY